jgi:hypothetical protein
MLGFGLKNFAFIAFLLSAGYLLFLFAASPRVRREMGLRPLWFLLGLHGVFFLVPFLYVSYLAPVAIVFVARRREEVGFYLILVYLLAPEMGQIATAGGVQLVEITVQAGASLGGLAVLLLGRGGHLRSFGWADLPFLAFALLALFTTARGASDTHVLRQALQVAIQYVIPYFVITRAIATPQSFERMMNWLCAAGCMLALILLYEVYASWPLYTILESLHGLQTTFIKQRLGLFRAFGPFFEATRAGFVLVLILAAVFARRRAFRSPALHAAVLALISLGMFAPQSRGAFLGAALVIACTALYQVNRRGYGFTAWAAVIASVASLSVLSFLGKDSGADDTVDYRNRLLTRGVEEFWRDPLLGDSHQDIVARMPDMIQGEGIVDFVNLYLYFALVGGAVGLLLFLIAILPPAYRLWLARYQFLGPFAANMGAAFSMLAAATVVFWFAGHLGNSLLLLQAIVSCGLWLTTRRGIKAMRSYGRVSARQQVPLALVRASNLESRS